MKVIAAKNMGFCAGVARAVNTAYELAEQGEICNSYGLLIHNNEVAEDLAKKGIGIIENLDEWQGGKLIIRAHGVPPSVEDEMQRRGIEYIDRTCPHVKTIHRHAEQCKHDERTLIILGTANHPEVIGTLGYAPEGAIVIEQPEDILKPNIIDPNKSYTLVVQTTYDKKVFDKVLEIIDKSTLDVLVKATICNATVKRQEEAESLSKSVDLMIVFGDKDSANSQNLFEICKKNCPKAIFVRSIHDIQLQELSKDVTIGVTAGASTPPTVTKEALLVMNDLEKNIAPDLESAEGVANTENTTDANQSAPVSVANQSFEEMLDESLVSLHTGDVVKGTVIQVTSNEVTVNLGYKSDGIITKAEFTEDPNADLETLAKPGDVIEVLVMRVNDGDGNVLASKRRMEAQANYKLIEQAFNEKTPVVGRVKDLVKGGMIASVYGNRVFVPSSQISNRYVEDLSQFKGQELNFQILEFDRSKRRIVAGRRELASVEQKERREQVFATLEVGQKIEGTVSRITDFGAFVDIGGVDGLIHISELAWRRVRKVADILSVGEQVTVTVIDVNVEKNKISLSLKDINNNPWNNVAERYPVGSLIEGKVVRIAAFGAFVSLEDGVDGLVHVSQIADKHVAKPDDELTIGDTITVKVTDVDEVNKKISLSKKQADAELRGDYDDYDDDDYDDDYDDEVAPEEEATE